MPDHPLCPPHDLPETPCTGFFYCPDPLTLTPEQLDALFPREQVEAFVREVYRTPTQLEQPSSNRASALEKAHVNGR